jgi:hypothetical protein
MLSPYFEQVACLAMTQVIKVLLSLPHPEAFGRHWIRPEVE